jgi:hypothetical protein
MLANLSAMPPEQRHDVFDGILDGKRRVPDGYEPRAVLTLFELQSASPFFEYANEKRDVHFGAV